MILSSTFFCEITNTLPDVFDIICVIRADNNGVFILVTGYCTLAGQQPRRFVQSFILAMQVWCVFRNAIIKSAQLISLTLGERVILCQEFFFEVV